MCNATIPKGRCILHVTSEVEKKTSLLSIPKASAVVIANGVEYQDNLPSRNWKPNGRLRLLFLGRLDPKKGIENLLRALAQLSDDSIGLTICGMGDPRYAETLRALVRALGLNEQVNFLGHVTGDAKRSAFLEADICVVPSHSENFGMVVAEALAHGVPVVVSKGAPWAEVEEKGCGRWVENSPDSLAGAILDLRARNLAKMGSNGSAWMRRSFQWKTIADEMLGLYRAVVRGES